jgi:hypothetical protein
MTCHLETLLLFWQHPELVDLVLHEETEAHDVTVQFTAQTLLL